MSKFYTEKHRALQEKFDTRRTADLLENAVVHSEFEAREAEFIQSRDMFFLSTVLSTVDASGRPTVSYKGGAPGFVRVTSASSLLFPNCDGNGTGYSIGNIMSAPQIGLLFIDFETPNRLRVQGAAEVLFDHPLLEHYPPVAVESIWVNRPRYIHPHRKLEQSRYVPVADLEPPLPAWKRINIVQEALAKDDRDAQEARSLRMLTPNCLPRARHERNRSRDRRRDPRGSCQSYDRGDRTFVDGGARPAVMGKERWVRA